MTLLALHQLVDAALEPLIAPMDLQWATETYLTVDRGDLDALAASGEPQAALVTFEGEAEGQALLIAEPALCSTLLARMWRSSRNHGAPLTQVEGQILRQFVSDVVGVWRSSWAAVGIEALPKLAMATSMPVAAYLADGPWHVARTVVCEPDGAPVGVLLFCYPAHAVPALSRQRERITWRSRIARGLSIEEQEELREKLAGSLSPVSIAAPVVLRTEIPLGFLNGLERGDVLTFDAPVNGDMPLHVLDREVTARLARTEAGHLAFAVSGAPGDEPEAEQPGTNAEGDHEDYAYPDDTQQQW